jgi:Protein of unknown function (DUF2934)
MIDNDSTPKILQRAYEIWESEGRPHGRDKTHWFMAEAELITNTGSSVAETRKTKRKPGLASASEKNAPKHS